MNETSLGVCPKLCLFCCLSHFCVPFKYLVIKNQEKVPEVSLACQMRACHKFNTLIEILDFQNDLNRLE